MTATKPLPPKERQRRTAEAAPLSRDNGTDHRPGPGSGFGRLRKRRLLLWGSAVPAILVLGIATKLLSLGVFGGQAAAAFDARDAGAAAAAAGWLQPLNIPEPHKAPFAAGDSHVLGGNFDAARQRFAEALDLVPGTAAGSADACVIRVNLVLATERLGDDKLRAEDPASAAALFSEALDVVKAAPDGCFTGDSGTANGSAGERLEEAGGRLAGKLDAAGKGGDAAQEPAEDPAQAEEEAEPPQQGQLEQLEESARQSQRDRNSGREREDYLNDAGYNQDPDRPW
ncbi:conserved hypothetical protein [Pseudarthrobacter chlorophenolicus A6]|uniref:Uncharacterized protein n=1 Tax=Pseudarthrobacter chlorophenolicus (strain ATCC 700700 / DSM 12829 / CIP 107037 / JCM 12360 / KCTC 9906 / NCIMB 13794 / A6) TaxID=452863 RepID=B8H9M5_PSECP|nr:hypothetical protein [Pseudarthrobacter chlorophenolicus]ACL40094.1 conserved hypothetical protein [Pseudarthrobacter chlorophenolicus A6]SDQ87950.1 hypothetical protein SAMN04489738_3373 [Pseudarthrobacter chlorophenolicus]